MADPTTTTLTTTGSYEAARRPLTAERVTAPPVQLTSFVGRERELANAHRLLGTTRLLTLTGAGGSGKTRLAIELASRESSAYAGGAVWVELAPVRVPALVAHAVLEALGIREQSGARSAADAVISALRERSHLLLLDNCEHLVTACAVLVDAVLRACPGVRILATSREALGVAGEVAWLVPPLSLPKPDDNGHSEAVELFVDRARATVPGFELTPANAAAVAQICRRLDGLPLALELAAARLRALPPERLAERLDDRFRLLTTGNRAALPRHQTLRAAIDWSYELLGEHERLLLERVAVFDGAFALEAAEAVCAGEPIAADDVLDLLASLVEKSLLELVEAEGSARYRALETVREYGLERLEQHCDSAGVRRRHAEYFLALAEEAEPHLTMKGRPQWVDRLQADVDNLRQALAWTARFDTAAHLRLAGSLGWFWYSAGLWNEGRQWLEGALALSAEPTAPRGRALFSAGVIASLQGDTRAARPWLEEAIGIALSIGDTRLAAYSRNFLGVALIQEGDPRGPAIVELARAWFHDRDDVYGLRLALLLLGTHAMQEGDTARAVTLVQEALARARGVALDREIGISLNMLGLALLHHGDLDGATAALHDSLLTLRRDPQYLFIARSIETLAVVAVRRGAATDAARLFGAGEAIRQTIGAALFEKDRERLAPVIAALRSSLGDQTFERTCAEGRAMRMEEAMGFALDVSGRMAPAALAPAALAPAALAAPNTQPVASAELPADSTALVVSALGTLGIRRGDEPIPATAWSYAKPRELLLYLLVHPQGRTREQVGLALWPDASATQVRNNFHVTLHHLRKVLGRSDWVRFEGDVYRMHPELPIRFDAVTFDAAMTAALRDARRGRDVIDPLRAALDLYRGDFLESEAGVGDWHFEVRDRLQRLHADGLVALGDALLRAERYGEAAGTFQQLVTKDELHEPAYRKLMVARSRAGERNEAMRQYHRLVELLRRELAAAPERETTALYQRLQRGETI